jgi:N-alpha-acetyltransferase 15/16, NatA auxiliary subunit
VSSLASPLPPPVGPVLTESLSALVPPDLSLETYNSQYIQAHTGSGSHILASAKVTHKLGAPVEEVASSVFVLLSVEVQLDIKVRIRDG